MNSPLFVCLLNLVVGIVSGENNLGDCKWRKKIYGTVYRIFKGSI